MDGALRDAVKRELRPRGFTGTLPHLRRRSADRVHLISVQYHSSGGSFVVEVASCGADGYTTSGGKHIEPSRVTARDIPRPRPRLGSPSFPASGDHWFVFGPRSYELDAETVRASEHYEQIAAQVVQMIAEQAEPFWRSGASP
jgi:tRNA(Leu) C34 or U34 (ribose-2'-O)-methylase TrmL